MSNVDVQVLPKAFRGLQEWDAAIQRLKVIVVLPQCSSSALSDPVATIHSEHGGSQLSKELRCSVDIKSNIVLKVLYCKKICLKFQCFSNYILCL